MKMTNSPVYAVLALLAAGCAGTPPPPQIITQEVKVAVPVACGVKVERPAGRLAHSKDELDQMLVAAPNVTERARIVADQLLAWLGYGPKLEAALDGCNSIPQPPDQKVVK